jgi:hypothetical protein
MQSAQAQRGSGKVGGVRIEGLEGRMLFSAGGQAGTIADNQVFAPRSHPYGHSYGEWVAAFWQYALARPLEGHPFVDSPEYDFSAGQSGKVWFWSAPDDDGNGNPIEREVTIPKNTSLFLTVRDVEVSSLEEAPFFGATEEEQRAGADYFADHIRNVSVSIDGAPVRTVKSYRFDSPQFEFDAPTPWIFGATGGHGTAVGDGYYLMIKPLSKGTHTIEYSGTFHFDAGELGPDPLDLPHSGKITLNVVDKPKKASQGLSQLAQASATTVPLAASVFGSEPIGGARRAAEALLLGE